jgi:hypothetical protein
VIGQVAIVDSKGINCFPDGLAEIRSKKGFEIWQQSCTERGGWKTV